MSCSFSIDPLVRTIDERSRNGNVKVKTTAECTWTATSNVNWIAITDGGGGTGSGDVHYRVEANTSPLPRVGTITIAGQLYTVLQGGRDE